MRGIVAGIGALLGLLVCGGVALAAIAEGDSLLAHAALLGRQGVVQEFISGGGARENPPVILAKKKKSKKKKDGSSSDTSSGGGTIQIDPNTADAARLMMLPLLTREEVDAIVEYRKKDRIDTPEEMLEIKGVQPSHYRIFRHLIVIREEVPKEAGATTTAPEVHEEPPPQKAQEPQNTH